MRELVVHNKPRLGVNAFTNYLISPAGARRRILSEQKRPKAFRVSYYDLVMGPICEFLQGNADEEDLHLARKRAAEAPATKDWHAQRNTSCASAIRAVLKSTPKVALEELGVKLASSQPPKLIIGDVSISIRPELYLTRKSPSGETERGYLKLYFSKTEPLTKERGEYIAAIVHQWAEDRLANRGGCDRKLCRVLDVFTGRYFIAPLAMKRRRQDIADACQEIAAVWPLL